MPFLFPPLNPLAIDVETTGLNPQKDKLIGVAWYHPNDSGYVVITDENREEVLRAAQLLLARDGQTIIFHNAKFDLAFLQINPQQIYAAVEDTHLMAWVLDNTLCRENGGLSLAGLEERVLETTTKKGFQLRNKRKKIWDWEINELTAYAINDVRVTYELYLKLLEYLKEDNLLSVYHTRRKTLLRVYAIERRGFLVDLELLEQLIETTENKYKELEERWDVLASGVNPRSFNQVSHFLYGTVGIEKPEMPEDVPPFLAKKYTGTMTSRFILEQIQDQHPSIPVLLEMRTQKKLLEKLKELKNLTDEEGRVHPNFNLAGTLTGRFSCSKPNLQNVAKMRVQVGKEEIPLRNVFIPPSGHVLLKIDYSQQELRMLAVLSNDEKMQQLFLEGADIHSETSLMLFGSAEPEFRKKAKTVSFGIIYGLGTSSLAAQLEIDEEEAARLIELYKLNFQGISPFQERLQKEYWEKGFIEIPPYNRRYYLKDEEKTYVLMNAAIQGSCSDMLCRALNELSLDWPIVNLVHDEIVLEVPAQEAEEYLITTVQVMEKPFLSHIFKADGEILDRWK